MKAFKKFLVTVLCLTVVLASALIAEQSGSRFSVSNLLNTMAAAANSEYFSYTVSENKATITAFDTTIRGKVVVPSNIDGYDVVAIASNAFQNCSGITELIVPESVETIGLAAFKGMTSLERLTVPFLGASRDAKNYNAVLGYVFGYVVSTNRSFSNNDISNEPSEEFYYCYINAPSGTTQQYTCKNVYTSFSSGGGGYVPQGYFYFIPSSLKSVTVTDETEIGAAAFMNCENITEININDGITEIGEYAFYNTGISELKLPDTITEINDHSFADNSLLTKINIPDGITVIDSYAFYSTGISFVELPDGITEICKYAFSFSRLIELEIPDSVTTIGNDAFRNCDALEEVKLSDNLESIGNYAFLDCKKLEKIEFPSKLKDIGSSAFENCSVITELVVPESVETIGLAAFKGMTSLEKLTVPFLGASRDAKNYNAVLGYVFGYVVSTNRSFSNNDISNEPSEEFYYCYINAPSGTTQQYTCKNVYTSFSSGGGGYVPQGYFYFIPSSLKSVTVTDETEIGAAAFMNCENITEININDSITEIGEYAFYQAGISELKLPESLRTIGNYGIASCLNLKAILASEKVRVFADKAITSCDYVTVFGYSGSKIQTYCVDNNIPFVAYDDVVSISVSQMPENNQYPGRKIDITGMKIKVVSNNGTETELSNGFIVSPDVVTSAGEQEIAVRFGNAEISVEIPVMNISSIAVLKLPSKVDYVVGDVLDLSGVELQVNYSDGEYDIITDGFTTNTENLENIGEESVIISCYGKSTVLTVNVVALQALSLEIKNIPNKTEYFVGDEIDTDGLVIEAVYNNGKTATITEGFNVITVLDSPEITEIVIEHKDNTVSYPVKVIAVESIGWELESEPTKLKYNLGDQIETIGLIITEYFNNGKSKTVESGFEFTPSVFTESGEQTVIIAYNGSTAEFKVHVHDNGTWLYTENNVFEKKCGICGDVLETKTVDLIIDSEVLEIQNQSTSSLVVTVTDGFEWDIIFTSSDDDTVVVDERGNIFASDIGTAIITVRLKDTDISVSCEVNVYHREFTISWIADGEIKEESIKENAEIVEPESPQKVGYSFVGWTPEIPATMPAEDLTFTAAFEANTYDAIFEANGGMWVDGSTMKNVETKFDNKISAPNAPIKQGYVFAGWTPEIGVMDSVEGKSFEAMWRPATDTPYIVETYTMNTAGEFVKTVESFFGVTDSTVSVFPEFTEGFSIDTEKSVLSGKVAADGSLVLKAYVKRNVYTLTVVADTSSVENNYLFGEKVIKPADPQKLGYKFIGWSDEFPATMPSKNIVITAEFSANNYSVTFDANGGAWSNGLALTTSSVKYDSEIAVPETPERSGYIFAGWSYDGVNVGTNIGIMDTINGKKFVACWIASTDTVYVVETYTMNTEGNYIKSVQTFTGTTDEFVSATPSLAIGFSLNAQKSVLSGKVAGDNSLVLKVYIDRNMYTVSTDVDGEITETKCYYGASIPALTTPNKIGHTFIGWDKGVPTTMPAEDIVLTAVFTVNKYNAVFNANGGTWTDGATEKKVLTEYGTSIIAPSDPVRIGYVFAGWDSNLGMMDSVKGKTFKAIWVPSEDTIYTVETYIMNTYGEYEKSSQIFVGTTGDNVSAEYNIFEGFSLNSEKSVLRGTIAGDNSLVLKVYIDRKSYTFTLIIDGVSVPTSYYYGSLISEPIEPVKSGYKFIKWDGTIPATMPNNNVTVSAVFEKYYVCPDCNDEFIGESIISAHIAAEARMKATVSIKNNNGSKTINYGETLELTAIVSNKPADAKIYWYVDGVKKGEGETFKVTFESGTKTVEVKLVDSNGNVLKNSSGNEISDSEKVSVNSSFWQKIVSFFKNLFGSNRTVVQMLFGK